MLLGDGTGSGVDSLRLAAGQGSRLFHTLRKASCDLAAAACQIGDVVDIGDNLGKDDAVLFQRPPCVKSCLSSGGGNPSTVLHGPVKISRAAGDGANEALDLMSKLSRSISQFRCPALSGFSRCFFTRASASA